MTETACITAFSDKLPAKAAAVLIGNGAANGLRQRSSVRPPMVLAEPAKPVEVVEKPAVVVSDSKKEPAVFCCPSAAADSRSGGARRKEYEPPFKFIRALGSMEDYIARYNDRGLGDIVYALHMKSKVPVADEVIIKALKHLQEKVQHLRLAIQDDGYQRYFVELRDPEIIFKNCGSKNWMELFEEMLAIEYEAETGPLWQTRLTRMGPEEEASCQIVNGRINFGYILLIGFHHSITDGTSNAQFCKLLLEIINALLTGQPVPEGGHVAMSPSMWDLAPDSMRKFAWYNPMEWFSLANDCYNYGFNERSQYLKRFPPPPKTQPKSEIKSGVVAGELTIEQTSELLKACKRKGVTVSGAFTAAAGIAIYNLITRPDGPTKPLPKGKRRFGINHAVNLRRYFDKENQDACGCYFNFFDDHMTCDENSLANFWALAGEATESIKTNVDSGRALQKQRNLDIIFDHLYPVDWYCSWRRKAACHSANAEFSTSNLGAVDRMFSGLGSPVEVMKLYRSTAMHYLPSLYTWFFQTFRGRFTALLEFFTNFVTRDLAKEYINETLRVLVLGIDMARLPPATELLFTPTDEDSAEMKKQENGSANGSVKNGNAINNNTIENNNSIGKMI